MRQFVLSFQTSAMTHFDLWAKANGEDWQSLIFHMIDVGACAESLWKRLDRTSREIAIKEIGSDETAIQWLAFLAASHDIGKANPRFQSKNPTQRIRLKLQELHEDCRHGYTSGAYLKPWLEIFGFSSLTAKVLAHAVAAHHGTYFPETILTKNDADDETWSAMAVQVLDELATLFSIGDPFAKPEFSSEFAIWLTGFVSVADWLGSNERMTSWQNSESNLHEYLDLARRRAEETLEALNILVPEQSAARNIHDLIPIGQTPNGMQRLAERVADTGFRLAIIEAPTGEGKTEAAFRLAESTRSEGGGVFVALPTQATANGIYERVSRFLEGSASQKNRLIHSASWLYGTEERDQDEDSESFFGEDAQLAEDWFQGRGRALISPYGTGTIDQILISVLTVKHFFVRLWALSGKVVIVDEVHAYDEYMQSLLRNLLGWLRVLNCKVILLSATLPNSSRKKLLQAWNEECEQPQCHYPCITWIDEAGIIATESFEIRPRKPMHMEFLHQSGHSLIEQGCNAMTELMNGDARTGALLFNTVDSAQTAYEHLKEAFTQEVEVMLFHARFTMQDRKTVESKVLASFGREAKRDRKRILVATQVVEQSLDLDFDVMVTELAPIDLLIQRAGRLHRHRRNTAGELQSGDKPDGRQNPCLYVLSPSVKEDGEIELSSQIYDYVVQFCTYEYLKDGITLSSPADVSNAVNTVYDDLINKSDEAPFNHMAFQKAHAKRSNTSDRREGKAEESMICDASHRATRIVIQKSELNDDSESKGDHIARTRLEEYPTMSVIVSERNDLVNASKINLSMRRKAMLCLVRTPQINGHGLETPESWRHDRMLKEVVWLPLNEELENAPFVYNSEIGLKRIKY